MNFDFGNILTRSFQITWRHKSFWFFSIIPALVSFAGFFIFIAPVFFLSEESDLVGLVLVVWLVMLFLWLIATLMLGTAGSASLTLGIVRVERGEGSTSFMDLLRDGFLYFGQVLGAVLIVQMTFGLVMTAFFLFVFILTLVTMGIASICLQPIIILVTPLSFLIIAVMDGALAAIVSEGLGAWDAVKRAVQVVQAHVWKFIFLTLIVYFGTTIFSSIFMLPAMIPVMALPIMMETDIIGEVVILVLILFSCLFFPLMGLLSGLVGTFMNSTLILSYLNLSNPPQLLEQKD